MENTVISEPPEPESKIIGLTGGIGSGKSTVSQFIIEKGFPVYNSDKRAKEIVNEDEELKIKIRHILGNEAYDSSGLYDTKYVSSKVFENRELLQQLNHIIHPAVKLDFQSWITQQTTEFVFKETALLFELGLDAECYQTMLVTAEDNIRIKRVMDRDNKTYREVESIMDKQMPEKDKIKRADWVIYNNDGLSELKEEFDIIFSQFQNVII